MKEGILWVIVISFFFVPTLLYSADNNAKDVDRELIVEMKPDKIASEDHIKSGNQLIKELQYEKALLNFKKALLYNPFSGKAYNSLGICYKRLGLYDQAEKDLKIGIKYERTTDALTLLGLIYKYKGKYREARDLFLEVLTEKPECNDVITYLEEMEKVEKELMKKDNTKSSP